MHLYDLHCHTALSSCAAKTANIDDYLRIAAEEGVEVLGFVDHAWDSAVEGASSWYQKQPYEPLYQRKVSCPQPGVKVLFGVEAEFASLRLGATRAALEKLDYVLVAHSHTHMRTFVLPAGDESPERHARYLLESFLAVVHHPLRDMFFGLVHPFCPIGMKEEEMAAVLEKLTDAELLGAFRECRDAGLFLECNLSVANRYAVKSDFSYGRILRLAREAGCKFFLGSDKHNVAEPEKDILLRAPELIGACGLTEDDFTDARRRIQTL